MNSKPHFVLFSRIAEHSTTHGGQGGRWQFSLKSTTSTDQLEASDVEAHASAERLELLAVVRGLEALEQPSRVTLVTSSCRITRAVRDGLEQWRRSDWTWERFGNRVPIKNSDLWERVDRAFNIHQVRCRRIRIDSGHDRVPAPIARKNVSHLNMSARRGSRLGVLMVPLVAITRSLASTLERTAMWLYGLVPDTPTNPHATI